mgnify:CR=1 FL=1
MTTFFFYIPLPPNTLPQKRLSHIIANTKKLYKETIWSKTSWKVRNGQLGKFYFPVGKIFFLSWKIIFFQLGTFRSPFWRIFARFWPLMVIISEYQKSFTFSFSFRQKKHYFERWAMCDEQWGSRDVACSVRRFFPHANLANPANTSFISWDSRDLLVTELRRNPSDAARWCPYKILHLHLV